MNDSILIVGSIVSVLTIVTTGATSQIIDHLHRLSQRIDAISIALSQRTKRAD